MPKCIFHIPMQLDANRASASQIRPIKMLEAFQSIGYDVSVVMGNAKTRKEQGNAIKKRILAGERFDFVYSESSTMPTRLTEPNHLPVSRSIDFGFLRFCRDHGIKTGLFYRDVYWKFPEYRRIGLLKSSFAIAHYKQDLKEYARLLDVFFMPTNEAFEIVSNEIEGLRCELLPPGCDISASVFDRRIKQIEGYAHTCDRELRLLYVGGIGNHYGFSDLINAVKHVDDIEMTFCVRLDDWASYNRASELSAVPNVRIAHARGEELESLYGQADVAVMLFDANPYQKVAMPFKAFEYIAHGLPIISNGGTSAAKFVRDNEVGWIVGSNAENLESFLHMISHNRERIAEVSLNCMEVAVANAWTERARTVKHLLAS